MHARIRLIASLLLLFLLLPAAASLAGGSDVVAFTQSETEGEVTDSTVEGGLQPAVPAEERGEEEEDQPWTARFLAPTVLAIGVVALVLSGAYYLLRIRARYRVVE